MASPGGKKLWKFGQVSSIGPGHLCQASFTLSFPLPFQCFGEKDADEEFSDADVLSAVEFDDTGDFLATGDKGGRIVIFERADAGKVGA